MVAAKPDCTGQRFGFLTCLGKTNESKPRYKGGKKTALWLLQCDCGKQIKLHRGDFDRKGNGQKSCGCQSRLGGYKYPPIPSPYPPRAAEIVTKYLNLVNNSRYKQVNHAIQDEKLNRLYRAAWILCYRESQGEVFTEQYERQYINKWLYYASVNVLHCRKVEFSSGFMYNLLVHNKKIGNVMTESTLPSYPVEDNSQTQGNKLYSKKLKFKRY